MTEPEETRPDAQERLQAALEGFQQVNRTLPGGLPPFQLPPFLEASAGQDALVSILIEQGLIDEAAFVERKKLRMAEIIEHLAEQAAEVKRQALGLVVTAEMPGRNGAAA